MKTTKQLFELFRSKTKDGRDFEDKHVVHKTDDANGNGDEVFKGSKVKPVDRKKTRLGYNPGEDEKVYETAFGNEEVEEELTEAKKVVDPSKLSGGKLQDMLIGADHVQKNKDGTHTFYRGFFYRSGSTSEGHANRISKSLNDLGIKHDVIDHETQDFRPFRGGASVKSQNHHRVTVKIHPGQNIADKYNEYYESFGTAPEEVEHIEEKYVAHLTKNGKPAGKVHLFAIDQEGAEYSANNMVGNKPFRGYKLDKVVKVDEDLDEEVEDESEEKDYSKMSRDEKIAYHNRQMNAAHGKLTGRYWYHKDQLARFKKKPVSESKMKELATDMRNMDNGNFQKKYKKSKEQLKFVLGDPDAKKTVHEAKKAATPGTGKVDIDNNKFYVWAWDGEVVVYGTFDSLADAKSNKSKIEQSAIKRVGPYVEGQFRVSQGDDLIHRYLSEAELQEDDVIIVPGQGRSRKTGFIKHGESRLDHEVEMARSDLFSAAKNAKQVYEMIEDLSEEEGLEGWVQEKIIKANDYLNTIREYLEGKQLREMTGGVIAGGGVGESAGGTTIRTFSGDRYVVPAGQEHELDDYRNAVGIIKKNRRSPVPSDVYDEALATMMKYEEGQTGWRPADGVNEGIGDTLKQVGKGISDKITTMTSKEHREKWHVSGFTLNRKPGGGIMGRADYFITNEKFPNKKEALAYIKASQAKLNSYGKVGYFSLFVNISDHYFSDEPLFSKIEDPNKNEVQEGIGDKIKGAVRREKAKDLPLLQTRRDYAMTKGGAAYARGETRKGDQYMAYAEKDRKKAGDPSTNPAGTYRTKSSDYKG